MRTRPSSAANVVVAVRADSTANREYFMVVDVCKLVMLLFGKNYGDESDLAYEFFTICCCASCFVLCERSLEKEKPFPPKYGN